MIVALTLLLLSATPAYAEPLAVGSTLDPFVLEDQNGEPVRVGEETAVVLFARDMSGGDVAEAALEENGATLLHDNAAVFVSDISRMPGLITRFFALPSMRKRPYAMALDYTGKATADFPYRDGHTTLIRLDQSKVTAIEFVDAGEALRARLVATNAAEPNAASGGKEE